jgi:2-polyprenyl-6-methoxyphenol hydroxylase-like FAD-dependent oxidoreductase
MIVDEISSNDTILSTVPHGERSFVTLTTIDTPTDREGDSIRAIDHLLDQFDWPFSGEIAPRSSAPIVRTTTFQPDMEAWVDGRIAFLGNTAAPIHPLSWARPSLAIVDSAAFVDEIVHGTDSVDEALSRYETGRKAHRRSLRDDSTIRDHLEDVSAISQPYRDALTIRFNLFGDPDRIVASS